MDYQKLARAEWIEKGAMFYLPAAAFMLWCAFGDIMLGYKIVYGFVVACLLVGIYGGITLKYNNRVKRLAMRKTEAYD
ncbi:hypothetical protein [Jiella pelagia]|uniref:Uncharacterized protein n=1 Tax=Jiella pelagia TaxID=2986949 RepID=A0ABY7C1E8_9HYPH|nr:hypothetical protein [Jiella pelagia]WAP69051.1 hypothetical protein OH818_01565 [Jiella pelagia]